MIPIACLWCGNCAGILRWDIRSATKPRTLCMVKPGDRDGDETCGQAVPCNRATGIVERLARIRDLSGKETG